MIVVVFSIGLAVALGVVLAVAFSRTTQVNRQKRERLERRLEDLRRSVPARHARARGVDTNTDHGRYVRISSGAHTRVVGQESHSHYGCHDDGDDVFEVVTSVYIPAPEPSVELGSPVVDYSACDAGPSYSSSSCDSSSSSDCGSSSSSYSDSGGCDF